ncbi:MAG: tetratricopeptide repeat protein, partial [Planctomycetota bacterium]|nr:tetratricopeptide repeat protein [Planctomycetota bacterium]
MIISLVLAAVCSLALGEIQFSEPFIAAYRAGYQELKAGKHADALRHFTKASDVAEGDHEKGPVYARIGQCHSSFQNWQEAVTAFEQAIQHPIPGKYKNNLRHQRHIEDAFKMLMDIYANRLKDIDKASATLKAMSAYEGVHPSRLADQMKRLAEVCAREKHYDRALKLLNEALAMDGINDDRRSDLLVRIGRIHDRWENHEEALKSYLKAEALPKAPPHRVADAIKHIAEL